MKSSASKHVQAATAFAACFAALILPVVAVADGVEIVDFAGISDEPREIWTGAADRLQPQIVRDSQNCGVFGLDADGIYLAAFGDNGRIVVSDCVTDMALAADGSTRWLFPARIEARTAGGVLLSSTTVPQPPPVALGTSRYWTRIRQVAGGNFVIGGTMSCGPACTMLSFGRYGADGVLDASFGSGGFVQVAASNAAILRDMEVLANGKIVASARGSDAFGPTTFLVRLNADGTQDFTFGANGIVQPGRGSNSGLMVDSQQRIYVVTNYAVVRVLTDGTIDNTYLSAGADGMRTLVMDSADRIVEFGSSGGVAYISRRDNTGASDPTFNGSGILNVTFSRPIANLLSAFPWCYGTLQSGDRPVLACAVVGEADAGAAPPFDLALARSTASGVLDVTFGANQPDADVYPDPMLISPVTVSYGAVRVTSPSVTVTGINQPTSIVAVPDAEYSLGCNGTWFDVNGHATITSGQTFCLRTNASVQAGASKQAIVVVGGRAVTFTVQSSNSPADSVPDAFTFTPQTNVPVSSVVVSNSISVTGIDGYATASITGGEFSVGCTGTFGTANVATIVNGDTVCVRHTSAAASSTLTSTTLSIGGVSGTFTSTTAAPPPPPALPVNGGGGGSLDALLIVCLGLLVVGGSSRNRFRSRSRTR
jgi:uncharacterized delta-60 repeat protein